MSDFITNAELRIEAERLEGERNLFALALSHCIHDDDIDRCTTCPMYMGDGRCNASRVFFDIGIDKLWEAYSNE